MDSLQIPNPHHAGAPARMLDGRLFTDYRPACDAMPPIPKGSFGQFNRKQNMMQYGLHQIAAERSIAVLKAGSKGCVDTMVPELTKRVCRWDGCKTVPAHPAGVGTGRLPLPGRVDLVAGDPDVLAARVFPEMFDTFSQNPDLYVAAPARVKVPAHIPKTNRWSAPYGNISN